MPNPTEKLVAFSKKEATADQVMRALVEHDDWYQPATFLETDVVRNMVIYSQEFSLPPESICVFTDRAAADVAAEKMGRNRLGVYAGGIKGTELFGRLQRPALKQFKELRVNEASPKEKFWFIDRGAFGLCKAWADAVACERAMLTEGNDIFATLRNYEGWMVPVAKVDQTMVQLPIDGKGVHSLIFTAPDEYARFVQQLGPRGDQVQMLVVPGAKLFSFLLGTKLDGFLLNMKMPFDREAMKFASEPAQ